jgi:hypothetical protein
VNEGPCAVAGLGGATGQWLRAPVDVEEIGGPPLKRRRRQRGSSGADDGRGSSRSSGRAVPVLRMRLGAWRWVGGGGDGSGRWCARV